MFDLLQFSPVIVRVHLYLSKLFRTIGIQNEGETVKSYVSIARLPNHHFCVNIGRSMSKSMAFISLFSFFFDFVKRNIFNSILKNTDSTFRKDNELFFSDADG